MRFLSLSIIFVSFVFVLLLSSSVHGIPVSVSNPNAPPRHAEVHREEDLLSTVLGLVQSILGSLDLTGAPEAKQAQDMVDQLKNVTAGLPIPALPVALPGVLASLPRGAAEAVGSGSSYSSSTVQAKSTVFSSKASSSPSKASTAAASASAVHQQADVHPGHGRHNHRRQKASASASSSSGSARASSASASGSMHASSASASRPAHASSASVSGKPALAVVSGSIPPLAVTSTVPVALTSKIPSLPVSAPIPSLTLAIPLLVASGIPPASGSTKGTKPRRNTHHRR